MTSTSVKVWPVRPLANGNTHSNVWTKRIAVSLHKWVSFSETGYMDWPERPRCGYFFGGAYWYGLETAHTVAVYAVLATMEEPGVPELYSKAHLAERAIRAIRYLCYTHDTGPEECVRATSKNRFNSGTKWGGANDPYFQATQVGGAISYFGLAAWLLWDQLDDDTRMMVQNVTSTYADRWSEVDPLNGTYIDTQLEENAWTGIGIFTAALLFPEHPHHDKWWSAYHKWNINTTTTFRDRLSDELSRGVPLKQRVKAITLHPDYTTENHAFVHPTYMAASMHFRGRAMAALLLAGMPQETMDLLNDKAMYERTLKLWTEADGTPTAVQGQDWWFNQQHAFMHVHGLMNVLHHDSEAANLENRALTAIEDLQNSNTRGCYLEQQGEDCHIMPKDDQTAIDMEHLSASHMLNTYLIHKLAGSGAEPASEARLAEIQTGVREYPFGGVVVHRTASTFTSFSWRNHVMALSMTNDGARLITPLYDSYTGSIRIEQDKNGEMPFQESYVVDAKFHKLNVQADGFSVFAVLERGSKDLLQHVGFVSLPDGRSVYCEQFAANAPVKITKWESGAIGIRNENYSASESWAKGYRTLYMHGQSQRFESWRVNGSDTIADYPGCAYVNVDNEMGFLLYGSNGVRYFNHHVFSKWKGGEDRLVLNHRKDPILLQSDERSDMFAIVSLPNATTEQTAQLADIGRFYTGDAATRDQPHTAVWYDGQFLVYMNFGSRQEKFSFQELHNGGTIPLIQGTSFVTDDVINWNGTLSGGSSGYYSRSGTIALTQGNQVELKISVSGEAVIFMNMGKGSVTFICNIGENGVHQEKITLLSGAFHHIPLPVARR